MLCDKEAEELEARGFYRRAAARWTEVMLLTESDRGREEAARRRSECIRKVTRKPVRVVRYGELRDAVNRTHISMGLHKPGGEAFRRTQK